MSVDPRAPLQGETLMAYLVRTRPDYEWQDDDGASEPWAVATLNSSYEYFTVRLRARVSRAEWSAYVSAVYPAPVQVDVNVPPVWPGLDKVTLGTAVALDSGVTITEPMDGVLISITGTDPSFDHYYTYDDLRAYRNVGALVFISDDGEAEGFQPIGFVSAVYCCRSMKRAAAVKLKCGHGLAGTVTPWTVTGT
jgi:hypothetical protein